MLAAVKQNGYALEYADPELMKDSEIVMEAVKQAGQALEYADPELKDQSGCAVKRLGRRSSMPTRSSRRTEDRAGRR